jgi:hypothetical protein
MYLNSVTLSRTILPIWLFGEKQSHAAHNATFPKPEGYRCAMNADLIAAMRGRVDKCRRLADMVHQPEVREILLQMAADGDADIARLEAEASTPAIQIDLPRQS